MVQVMYWKFDDLTQQKKTVVLTCIKIRLKALYSFKCEIMYFRININ